MHKGVSYPWLVIVGVGMEFCFAKDGAMDELLFGGKVHECIFESLKPGDGQDWHCVVLLEEWSKDRLLVAAKCLDTCLVQ
jgi:hypothetical protein